MIMNHESAAEVFGGGILKPRMECYRIFWAGLTVLGEAMPLQLEKKSVFGQNTRLLLVEVAVAPFS